MGASQLNLSFKEKSKNTLRPSSGNLKSISHFKIFPFYLLSIEWLKQLSTGSCIYWARKTDPTLKSLECDRSNHKAGMGFWGVFFKRLWKCMGIELVVVIFLLVSLSSFFSLPLLFSNRCYMWLGNREVDDFGTIPTLRIGDGGDRLVAQN